VGHAEANGRTIEAAVAAAAAELGLRSDQVEFEVLEEAVPSTFGVIGRPARVRVTPRPITGGADPATVSTAGTAPLPPAAADGESAASAAPAATESLAGTGSQPAQGPNAARPGDPAAVPSAPAVTGGPVSSAPARRAAQEQDAPTPEAIEADTELAGDFLEGLLDVLDLDGDLTTWVDSYGGHVDLEGEQLDVLVGAEGETLQALQELTRLAVLRQAKHRVRLAVDINGFRSRRREDLAAAARAAAARVVETHEKEELWPMTASERKVVHDVVAVFDGARTESLGEEPNRRVVILPA
jgi:spoIIIJ-associated protein